MDQALNLESACEHCGTHFIVKTSQRFCCAGCEFVFGLIQSEGLGHYYQIREANPPICPVPAVTSSSQYEYCDDPEFIKSMSSDGLKIRFFLEGMNCTACLWLLEKLPDFCKDAESARVDMSTSTIEIKRKPQASFAAIAQILNRFGYRPHPLRESETSVHLQLRERRKDLIRIGTAAALTGNIMILAVSLYSGATGSLANQFQWLSGLLAIPVLSYCAWPFYRSAFASLRSFQLNLDVPIVIAIFAGIITSLWAIASKSGNVYFDSLSMLVFLLLSSRFILKGIQARQLRTTNLEDEILLGTVQRIRADGELESVSSLALRIGDVIEVSTECFIPVDGIVNSGIGLISNAVMTGESHPIQIIPGQKIEAGSQNLAGRWTLTVMNSPSDTRLAKILRDTESSAQNKSRFIHFSDHIANWFIAIVLAAATALVLYFWSSDRYEGLSRALALVIVTCPCVFGFAIPLSMSLAIRGAARKGIVIKNSDAIERLWNVKTLFFDKTGTLTKGEMVVTKMETRDRESLGIALALEKDQNHPVGRAIVKYLEELNIDRLLMQDITLLMGGGVSGKIDGSLYSLKPISVQKNLQNSSGLYSNYSLYREQTLLATFELSDEPRSEALQLLSWARQNKYVTKMISGDLKTVVENCGRTLGFSDDEVWSQVSPENKALALKKCSQISAMIGDGANDASALAAAGVGIAICGSLDVSLRAADVYLTRPNLNLITELFEIAKLTRSAIYRNLFFSTSFNILSGGLAACGLMTPLWAAVLMPISSLTVVMSSVWTGNRFLNPGETQ